jgi:hypothetical protein
VYNVLSYLYEMETGDVYKMKKAHDVYSGIGELELDTGSTGKRQPSTKGLPRIVEVETDGDEDPKATSNQENIRRYDLLLPTDMPGLDDATEDAYVYGSSVQQDARERDAQKRASIIVESFEGVKVGWRSYALRQCINKRVIDASLCLRSSRSQENSMICTRKSDTRDCSTTSSSLHNTATRFRLIPIKTSWASRSCCAMKRL